MPEELITHGTESFKIDFVSARQGRMFLLCSILPAKQKNVNSSLPAPLNAA
jgi:hypothetical protein